MQNLKQVGMGQCLGSWMAFNVTDERMLANGIFLRESIYNFYLPFCALSELAIFRGCGSKILSEKVTTDRF
jgi:hypothetical protein